MAEASAVKKRVSKRRTRPGGVMARAIKNSPDGSGSRPASENGFHAPSSFGADPSALRPRQRPVSSQASRIAATASDFAREAAIFGLPFNRLGLGPGGDQAPTRPGLVDFATGPAGKHNLPGKNPPFVGAFP